jgi:hypothetical protein
VLSVTLVAVTVTDSGLRILRGALNLPLDISPSVGLRLQMIALFEVFVTFATNCVVCQG